MKSAAVVNYAPTKGAVEIREIEMPSIGGTMCCLKWPTWVFAAVTSTNGRQTIAGRSITPSCWVTSLAAILLKPAAV